MSDSFKISIPKPCHEDWRQMKSESDGRFCQRCAKSVVDFTDMEADAIRAYFLKHQNERVCGRFRKQQLDSLVIRVPRQVLLSQTQFHKMFLLALLVTMGTTLFSCSDGRKIDAVEIVDQDSQTTTGAPIFTPEDTVKTDRQTSKKNCIKPPDFVTISGDVALEPVKGDTVIKPQTGAIAADTIQNK